MCMYTWMGKDINIFKMKKYETKYWELPDVIKFKIISFLYTKNCDKMSLYKAIHNYNMEQCAFELYVYSSASCLCKTCKMPRDSLLYKSFKKSLSKHEICIICTFHVLTTSNFLLDLCLYVNENHIKLVTEDAYQNIYIFNRFERVADMLRTIRLFYKFLCWIWRTFLRFGLFKNISHIYITVLLTI